jgi:pimeloyl-ACP methyl ester carboxylesterase
VTLTAVDGVRLDGWHLPPDDPHHADLVVVLLHGFTGSWRRPALVRIARGLAPYAGVLLVDQRGHGRSGGLSTLGDLEVLDVDAAVAAARALGYGSVVTQGWSMGGSSALRHAALAGAGRDAMVRGHPVSYRPDAVISVSAASRWFVRETAPMRRLHWLVQHRVGRLLGRRLGVRVDPSGWPADAVPLSPVEAAARITIPLLVVHGDADAYFSLEHPRALVTAAGPVAQLWEIPGFGHAENAADALLLDRIGGHLRALVTAP